METIHEKCVNNGEIPREGLQELEKCCNVDMRKSISNDELLEIAPYLDGVLCAGHED